MSTKKSYDAAQRSYLSWCQAGDHPLDLEQATPAMATVMKSIILYAIMMNEF